MNSKTRWLYTFLLLALTVNLVACGGMKPVDSSTETSQSLSTGAVQALDQEFEEQSDVIDISALNRRLEGVIEIVAGLFPELVALVVGNIGEIDMDEIRNLLKDRLQSVDLDIESIRAEIIAQLDGLDENHPGAAVIQASLNDLLARLDISALDFDAIAAQAFALL